MNDFVLDVAWHDVDITLVNDSGMYCNSVTVEDIEIGENVMLLHYTDKGVISFNDYKLTKIGDEWLIMTKSTDIYIRRKSS